MIVVTGGAGFIGSNLVHALNEEGVDDIVVVAQIADYLDKDELIALLASGTLAPEAVFHLGACSSTTQWDGRFMMRENYDYSKRLLEYCESAAVPLLYASSASVYGGGGVFVEDASHEAPLNVYGFSKTLFDRYVRRRPEARSQVAGFRFFNVYGPREGHKGTMASVALHCHRQLLEGESVRLFEGTDGYGAGEQRRDFVYVDDVCKAMLWFWRHPQASGIVNVGTGRAQSFNEVAQAVIDWHGRGRIEYITFPEHLRGSYQSFTEADLTALRGVGYDGEFRDVRAGVFRYLDWLRQHPHAGAL